MKTPPAFLSKTRMMKGFRCSKALYLDVFHRDLAAPLTERQQATFKRGNLIGVEARKLFPEGLLIDCEYHDFVGALEKTRKAVESRTDVIFEASFQHAGCYARVDILCRADEGWDMLEVKSTTSVKPEHLEDIAFQSWVTESAGINLRAIKLVHLNPECVYPDLSNLFADLDVTKVVREMYPEMPGRTKFQQQCLSQDGAPDIDLGPHCLAPYECDFKAVCWEERAIPEVSIFNLPQGRDRQWEWYKKGYRRIDDLPARELNVAQHRAAAAHATGQRFIHPPGIRNALKDWKFPLVFLDFETINPAIPKFSGCHPYDQVPFQFSVHVIDDLNGQAKHFSYLHTSSGDPRPQLIPALLNACQGNGSVVAYYSKFEADRLTELAAFDDKNQGKLMDVVSRLVDPLPIFRDHVYDIEFNGSFSLKSVAPALLGKDHGYDALEVADGTAAQRAYEEMISLAANEPKRAELHTALLDYCNRDTELMADLVKWLYRFSGGVTS